MAQSSHARNGGSDNENDIIEVGAMAKYIRPFPNTNTNDDDIQVLGLVTNDVHPISPPRLVRKVGFQITRRRVYVEQRWCVERSKLRPVLCDDFAVNPILMEQAHYFIKYEVEAIFLRYLDIAHHVIRYIMNVLPRVDISSPSFLNFVRQFFGGTAPHFVHELRCFVNSRLHAIWYYMEVEYDWERQPTNRIEVVDISNCNLRLDLIDFSIPTNVRELALQLYNKNQKGVTSVRLF